MDIVLESLNLPSFPAYGLLALVVFMILTGKLNPKSYADEIRADRDAWKTAYNKSEEGSRLKDSQISELLEVSKTVRHLVRSLPGGEQHGVSEETVPPANRSF